MNIFFRGALGEQRRWTHFTALEVRMLSTRKTSLGLIATLAVVCPSLALSQSTPTSPGDPSAAPAEITPQGTAPDKKPPPPPAKIPTPPSASASAKPAAPAPPEETGQWVYTGQYGWVWAAYGDEYVYTPADEAGDPYEYVYAPGRGWAWVAAPWIWGTGPLPYFGVGGPWRFHWYRGPAYHFRASGRPLFRGSYGGHWGGHGRYRR
jgi:hypothetical protein